MGFDEMNYVPTGAGFLPSTVCKNFRNGLAEMMGHTAYHEYGGAGKL
jgi:hypothetical protein